MHQRELYLAIKLLVLAARDDDYAYGVRYCRKLIANGRKSRSSTTRTLRNYRLLGYLFDDIQQMMRRGIICIRSLNSISNELEIREKKRFKYQRVATDPTPLTSIDISLKETIEQSFESLLSGLEHYAESILEPVADIIPPDTSTEQDISTTLNFDIGLEAHIEMMINKLNLQPSGPHGIIDLGDDDIIAFDDY